jgi:pyruvate kinase
MRVHTKIICTIGPSVATVDKMLELIDAGMNVARLNFSHGTHEEHLERINMLKEARRKAKRPLAIMLDTKGPEIRVGILKDKEMKVHAKDVLSLVGKSSSFENELLIEPFEALSGVKKKMKILFDDGYIISRVVGVEKKRILVEIENDGVIKSRKGVNIPDAEINLPALTQKDIEDLSFGSKEGIDIVAASFIRSAEHVLSIKKLLLEEGKKDIPIIAKIENIQGIENFDAILAVSDGIMVARGDLGVEINIGLVPKIQKDIIRKATAAFKPVIIATQMLESMINNPRPTRAEVSDVANAIYDSASAVMLSGETAAGKYPIEVVKQMKNIVKHTEEDFHYLDFFNHTSKGEYYDVSTAVSIAAVKTAYTSSARAIFVYTSSGFTARLISALRPRLPIVALTADETTYHQLSLYWGVVPVLTKSCKCENEAFVKMAKFAEEEGIVSFGDLVVATTGMPFGKKGSTNMMMVESIGNILVRGMRGHGKQKTGEVLVVHFKKEYKAEDVNGKILIIPRCDETYLPLMKAALAIVLQNQVGDIYSEKYAIEVAKQHNIALLIRADNAMTILNDKQRVVIDPERGLIYSNDRL